MMSSTYMGTSTSRSPNSPKRFPDQMRVLGIDCGSRITGYGVVDTNGADCVLVRCGAIRSRISDPLAVRLRDIHAGIIDVIRELGPDVAAFESLFYSNNVQSALKLGHVRGVSPVRRSGSQFAGV